MHRAMAAMRRAQLLGSYQLLSRDPMRVRERVLVAVQSKPSSTCAYGDPRSDTGRHNRKYCGSI